MVGYEGMFGLTVSLLFILVTSFIPCPFGAGACAISDEGMPFI